MQTNYIPELFVIIFTLAWLVELLASYRNELAARKRTALAHKTLELIASDNPSKRIRYNRENFKAGSYSVRYVH